MTPGPTGAPPGAAHLLNVALGNFFFKHRNTLFPLLFAAVALFGRPRILGPVWLDDLLVLGGAAVALLGQAVRLWTIGYEYIERGGKEGKVYASRLVQGGVYALTRNPMYLGNGLIAIGMTMVTGAPRIYFFVLPFFLFVYQALIVAEEVYLRRTFGSDYGQYCASVPRLIPAWSRARQVLGGLSYDWRRAVRKELSTLAGLGMGLTLLPLWRTYWLEGWHAATAAAPLHLGAALLVLALYGVGVYLKKQRIFLYRPAE